MKKLILLCLFCVFRMAIYSQNETTAPSLQIGLSGIKLSKGTFDSELLAQIIAEKQQEIKVRLVKTMLLKRLGVDNGLFYAYIDNTIDIVTKEKDESVRVKNLLENTVNLAFVVSYAEYYLRTLKKDTREWSRFKRLALVYGYDEQIFEDKRPLSLLRFGRIKYNQSRNIEKDTLSNNFVPILLDMFAEVVRQNEDLKKLGLMRTCYFQNYTSLNAYLNLFKDENQFVEGKYFIQEISKNETQDALIRILRDPNKLTIEKFNTAQNEIDNSVKKIDNYFIKNRKRLSDENWKLYSSIIQNYRQSEKDRILDTVALDTNAIILAHSVLDYFNSIQSILDFLDKKNLAQVVFNDIDSNLTTYVKYAGFIKSISQKGAFKNETSIVSILNKLDKIFPCSSVATYKDLVQILDEATEESKTFYRSEEDLQNLIKAQSFIEKIKYLSLNSSALLAEFDRTVKPALNSLGKYSTKFLDLRDSLNTNINCIACNVDSDLTLLNIDFNSPFISLLGSINAFDEVETYSKFLNQLSDAGDVFNDEGMRTTINIIISFIRGYIKVERDAKTDEPIITLDVESFLAHLHRLPYNCFRPVELHFTLGANTASFSKPYFVDSSNSIRNYSYMSEKIGVKWKIIDWAYLNSFSQGDVFRYYCKKYKRLYPPREPTVSNLHLLFYGSGILYNLVNTGTTKAYSDPIVAAGVGLTFYNDLDVNLSIGKPISKDYSFLSKQLPTIYNIGFDIQFFEYLDRLNQKRKAKKTEELIQEAKNY
jgi:hypothetical protein